MNPPPLAWDPMLLCRGLEPAKGLQGPAVKEQRWRGASTANKHFKKQCTDLVYSRLSILEGSSSNNAKSEKMSGQVDIVTFVQV